VVRSHFDVEAGRLELAGLLERWKPTLERTLKRSSDRASESSPGARAAHTLRYDEVALAFDDDVPSDGPTFEAHAFPSDAAALAALPHAEHEPLSTVPPSLPRTRSRAPLTSGPALVVAVFLLVGAVVALLVKFAR
jgi:hypothetical protein